MSVPGFWDNPETAQDVGRKRARIEKRIASAESIESKSEELDVLLELQKEGESVDADIESLLAKLTADVDSIEMTMKLSGEHDDRDAIVAIHPGAGGTESQDWAEMLLRMYLRYCERRGWSTEMVDYTGGDEAGIKSATFMVRVVAELVDAGVRRQASGVRRSDDLKVNMLTKNIDDHRRVMRDAGSRRWHRRKVRNA